MRIQYAYRLPQGISATDPQHVTILGCPNKGDHITLAQKEQCVDCEGMDAVQGICSSLRRS